MFMRTENLFRPLMKGALLSPFFSQRGQFKCEHLEGLLEGFILGRKPKNLIRNHCLPLSIQLKGGIF